jgi:gas vesicle protein
MTDTTRASDAVLGFVCGAVVGAGLALLLAPASGRDTRRKIGDTARRLGEGVSDKLGDLKDTVASRTSEIREDLADAIDTGRAAANGALAHVPTAAPVARAREGNRS